MDLLISLSTPIALYLLVLWLALTAPSRPPQHSELTMRDEWESFAHRMRKIIDRMRRGRWRRRDR